MKDGVMEVCTARLCPVCIGEMEREHYFVRPTREQVYGGAMQDVWEPGVCQRCGRKRKMTKLRRYLLRRQGMKERGMLDEDPV